MTELSNWGRWGKADQIGTLNLITADKRKAGAEAGARRRLGVAGPHDRQGEGRRQPAAARTGDGARRRRPRDGPLLHLVPRLGHHAHRRALPLLVRGEDLQRLRAVGDRARARLPEQRHREPEGRHHDARHPRRSAAHEERAVSRAGHGGLPVGSRSVGEVRRHQDRQRRRAVPPHRPLGAARPRRDRGTSRPTPPASTRR